MEWALFSYEIGRPRVRCCSRSGMREAKTFCLVDLTFMAGQAGDVTVVA